MDTLATYDCDLNLKATELRLGLPGIDSDDLEVMQLTKSNKRTLADVANEFRAKESLTAVEDGESDNEGMPAAKAQIVGWPPIQSFRRSSINQARKVEGTEAGGIYVKVSMDGAPYLRKIDLKGYKGYQDLLKALEEMFKSFKIGEFLEGQGYNGHEYISTYEDKDGDWMLVGDVPWDMFISSCKKLRIMKESEARGLGSGA